MSGFYTQTCLSYRQTGGKDVNSNTLKGVSFGVLMVIIVMASFGGFGAL